MFTTIIACIIANILTMLIVALAVYLVYRKFKPTIQEKFNEIKDKIDNVSDTVKSVIATIETIKETLDKLPFLK